MSKYHRILPLRNNKRTRVMDFVDSYKSEKVTRAASYSPTCAYKKRERVLWNYKSSQTMCNNVKTLDLPSLKGSKSRSYDYEMLVSSIQHHSRKMFQEENTRWRCYSIVKERRENSPSRTTVFSRFKHKLIKD